MDEVLEAPSATGDFEPLIHGVSPERPSSFEVRQFDED